MNVRRGLRRVLVVLIATYWLVVVAGSVWSYRDAYGEVITSHALSAEYAKVGKPVADIKAALGPSEPGEPSQSELQADFAAYEATHPDQGGADPTGTMPLSDLSPAQDRDLASRYRDGSMSTPQRAVYEAAVRRAWIADPYALHRIAESEGLRAVGDDLRAWVPLFIALMVGGVVVRWVWRGFSEPPPASP